MNTKRAALALVALSTLIGACANNPSLASKPATTASASAPAAPSATPAPAGASQPRAAGALLSKVSVGDIIVGSDGRALYGFTNDTAAASTCYGTCADAWPPVIVGPDWTVGPGLDTGIFATTVRDDGQLQLVAGKWPLYYYTGDATPGDIKGQGSGDVWFLIDPTGRLITGATGATAGASPAGGPATTAAGAGYGSTSTTKPGAAPAPTGTLVGTAKTALGTIVTDAKGLTLYGFLNDVDRKPSCDDACAQAWPPILVDGSKLPDGLDPKVYSVVQRHDGTWQLAAGKWPLYRFGGDAAKGDTNGQGSGTKWFVVAPDGSLIKG